MNRTAPTGKAQWLLLAGLLVFVFFSALFQVSDVDVGYHLRTAAYILGGKGIPATNTFSAATPEHTWLLQQWLGTLFFYAAFAWGGVKLLITAKALVAVLIMLLVWLSAREDAGRRSGWPFWVLTLGTVATRMRFFERPDLLSALFFAALIYADRRWNGKAGWRWAGLPLMMAVWANVHSGVIYGVVFLGVVSAAEILDWWLRQSKTFFRARDSAHDPVPPWKLLFQRPASLLVSVAAACLAVQCINPNGCRVLWVPISQFGSPFWQSVILEYYAPTWSGARTFYVFLGGLVLLQLITLRKLNLRRLLVSVTFGYLACRSQRSILFFIIAAAPHAAALLEQVLPTQPRSAEPAGSGSGQPAAPLAEFTGGSAGNRGGGLRSAGLPSKIFAQPLWLPAAWLLIVALVFVPNRTLRFGFGWYRPYYPLEIYRLIHAEVPPQNIFNEMRYGGSLLWWLYPRFRPFIDGRGDAYSVEFWQEQYFPALEAKPEWRRVFQHYDMHAVLLPIELRGKIPRLGQTLFNDPDWALVAYNDDTLFFLERTPANRRVIAAHEFKLVWPGDWSLAKLNQPATQNEAAVEVKRAFAEAPDSLFTRTAMARLCLNSEQFDRAAKLLGGILRERDAGPAYWRDYGYSLFKLGKLDEADRAFAAFVRKDPSAAFGYFMRYVIALKQQDRAAAREFIGCAVKADPGNPDYRSARESLDAPPPQPKEARSAD